MVNEIQVGDLVRLKSGSARMTVTQIIDGVAEVVWSDYDTKKLQKDDVAVAALVLADEVGQ